MPKASIPKILLVFALALPMLAADHARPNKAQQTTKDDKLASPVVRAAPEHSSSPPPQPDHQEHIQADVRVVKTPEKDGYDKASVWINLALALIGAFGIGAALITLQKLERQTKATEEAANAAYGSVAFAEAQFELMKEKERARLEVKSGSPLTVDKVLDLWTINANIKLRNIGSSRAFITNAFGAIIVKDGNGTRSRELGDFDTLSFPDQFLDPSDTPIEVSLSLFPNGLDQNLNLGQFADDLHQGNKSIVLHGFIEYNTLSMRFRRDFGYTWKVFDRLSYLAGLIGRTEGPQTDEERISEGYWTIDPQIERPEYPVDRNPKNNHDATDPN